VPVICPKNGLTIPGAYAGSTLVAQEDVWEALERFSREIGRSQETSRHKLLALEAVRASLQAEAVYWYGAAGCEAVEVVGTRALPAGWCAAFARQLLEETPGVDGRLLRSELPSGPRTAPCQPQSAAMVRVSRSQASWIVALSLNPRRRFQVTDLRIMSLVRQILVNHRRRCDLTNRMSETLSWLIRCLTTSIDAHVPHARGHSERVANIAVELGKRMRLPQSVLNDLYFASLLHDIGITHVPQSLLLKPGSLTAEEYDQVKIYPVIGDGILGGIKQLAHLRPAVRHHHERFDGRGFPDRLAGDGIPLMARILGVADAFDAMHSPRPHRPALSNMRVEQILTEGAGRQWDPRLVEQVMTGRPHFHSLCRLSAVSETTPAVQKVVDAWNVHSSGNAALGGAHDPPGHFPP
jgi:HD-GYP domain-containing protein (c-di-GMP phosphodiesterase class II)